MTTKTDTSDTKKRVLMEALEKTMGVVSTACRNANISRDTFYRWYKEDDNFKEEVDKLKNVSLDFAESKLLEQINGGNTTAIIFYLKTQGKHRGYVETHDISSSDLRPIRLIMGEDGYKDK